jgi:hypothetical protein
VTDRSYRKGEKELLKGKERRKRESDRERERKRERERERERDLSESCCKSAAPAIDSKAQCC